MPSTWLSSKVLAIENKSELWENACLIKTEKPFGYLLVDNKPSTPADKQILGDLFGECYVYHFSAKSPVETKPVGK